MTCSRSDPAASSAVFNSSRTRSACCSKGALTRSSPVLGSNGGIPEMKTMSPARVQVETGAPHFSKLLSNGSTRIISLFTICLPIRFGCFRRRPSRVRPNGIGGSDSPVHDLFHCGPGARSTSFGSLLGRCVPGVERECFLEADASLIFPVQEGETFAPQNEQI